MARVDGKLAHRKLTAFQTGTLRGLVELPSDYPVARRSSRLDYMPIILILVVCTETICTPPPCCKDYIGAYKVCVAHI